MNRKTGLVIPRPGAIPFDAMKETIDLLLQSAG